MKVHGVPMSTCTARVLLCLYEKGLEFEIVRMDLAHGPHNKEPYLSLNVLICICIFCVFKIVIYELCPNVVYVCFD